MSKRERLEELNRDLITRDTNYRIAHDLSVYESTPFSDLQSDVYDALSEATFEEDFMRGFSNLYD